MKKEKNNSTSTVSDDEIAKFEAMAEDWWNPEGKFKPLHDLTPTRLEYITNLIKQFYNIEQLNNLKVLDIGCGGGLVSEPLARLKANVTGIDASAVNIQIAKSHKGDLKVNYQQTLAEDLTTTNERYDVVLALEILEHVENIELFIKSCSELLSAKGIIIFSTINRTFLSYIKAIIGAEYVLKWLPIGTHEWSKFLKPSEIDFYARKFNLKIYAIQGMSYSLLSQKWSLSKDISNNYFMAFQK